ASSSFRRLRRAALRVPQRPDLGRPRGRPSTAGQLEPPAYPASMADEVVARARAAMVRDQLHRRGIRDKRVLAVMADLPRELFIPDERPTAAYDDRAIAIEAGQS